MSEHDTRATRLVAALDDFIRSSPDVEAAAVVSFDGLPMASALPDELEEDRVGAMSAALLSLGEQAAIGLGRGLLNQVFVEGEHGFVFLMSARDQAVLAAIAGRTAKIGFMLFEMRRAADRIGRALEQVESHVVAPEALTASAPTPPPATTAPGPAANGPATNGAPTATPTAHSAPAAPTSAGAPASAGAPPAATAPATPAPAASAPTTGTSPSPAAEPASEPPTSPPSVPPSSFVPAPFDPSVMHRSPDGAVTDPSDDEVTRNTTSAQDRPADAWAERS